MAVADIYKRGNRTFRTTIGVFVALVGVSGFLPHRERALLQIEAATGLVARSIDDATFQALPVIVRTGGGPAAGLVGVPALRVAGVAAPIPVIPAIIVPATPVPPATQGPAGILPLGEAGPGVGGGTGDVLGDDAGPTQLASLGGLPGLGGGGGGGSISNPADTSTGGSGSTSTGGTTSTSTGGTSTGGTTTSTGGTTTSTSTGGTTTSTGGTTTSTSTGGDTSTSTSTSTSSGGVPPVAPVPEPATWAMMILGFGFIGAALRKARRPALV